MITLTLHRPLQRLARLATANLLLAAAYLGAGWFGLLTAAPGQLGPLTPASGVAIAALATFGWRLLPGLVLGALVLSDPRLFPSVTAAQADPLLVMLIQGGAAVLQAVVGAALVRRCCDLALAGERDVLRFVLLAPLACAVRSSVALGALAQLGVLQTGPLALTWLTMWAADSTGVLLAAPLCWVGFGRPRDQWRQRAALVGVALTLTGAIFVVFYHQALRWERDEQLRAFRTKADEVGHLMQAALQEHERYLAGVAQALDGRAGFGSAAEFAQVARIYLHQRPELLAMAWLPRVAGEDQRQRLEQSASLVYGEPYRILQVSAGNSVQASAPRAEYYPILYVEPRRALRRGLDFMSEPRRARALAQAALSNRPTASAPVPLHPSGRLAIHLLQAVGASDGAPTGMLDLTLRIDTYIGRALSASGFAAFAVQLDEISGGQSPVRLVDTVGVVVREPEYLRTLHFGERTYLLRLAPTPAYLASHTSWQSWSVLSGGLVLAALMGALMLVVSGERAQIQAQVEEATQRLREREERLQAILDHAADAIITANHDGVLLTGNNAAARLFHYPSELLAGLSLAQLLSLPAGGVGAALGRLARADRSERELSGMTRHGEHFPLLISVSQVSVASAPMFVCIMHDLTEQRRAEEHIHRLAHRDTLTGLENRLSLGERLEQLLAQARRSGAAVALLFLDLDRFKKVNDSQGHQAGDQLLVEVAQRLRVLLRNVDIIARLGGDEFIVVMSGHFTPELVGAAAVRVVHRLSQPYMIEGHSVHSGASVGIAMFPADADNAATLLRHADLAMYEAKNRGRGNFQFFSSAMNTATHERLAMESRLRLALGKQEFELYLQPQIALASGSVVGAEALLRWHQPELGTIGPERVIAIAEESGLIVPLGDWVMQEAIGMLAQWRDSGLDGLRLAVNLSARQCHGDALLPRLDALLHQHGVDPRRLELEITESAAMHDPESTRALLRQLRTRGIQVAIDDFGTGYSSLNYLKLFAIDRIKIDRGFVTDIETDPNDAAIVSATIGLAHALGLEVIAEGVETAAQRRFLQAHQCDQAQGFLYAEPMPFAQFDDYVRNRRGARFKATEPPVLAP